MKKFILFVTFLAFSVSLSGRTDSSAVQRQNNIMISSIELITNAVLNVSYERLLMRVQGSVLMEYSDLIRKITLPKYLPTTGCILVKNMPEVFS